LKEEEAKAKLAAKIQNQIRELQDSKTTNHLQKLGKFE